MCCWELDREAKPQKPQINLQKSSLQDRILRMRKGSEVQVAPKLKLFEPTFTIQYEEN
jgi:hypothetical protein